ncbi:ATP-binding protein [Microcoleus sp. FACHB-53]|nr:ATP-binding protein [Microcoleus sp. FACHB-53]
MNSEEAFECINRLFLEKTKTSLSQGQKDVILGIWQGKTYQVISDETNWAYQTVKETASELFKKISKLLEIKVNKANFVNTIEQLCQQPADNISSSPKLISKLTNPFTPQHGIVDNLELFFNRDREIRRVFEVLNSGSSVALIGEEGIGKSSLLWKICQLAESCLHSPRQSVFLDLNWVNDENDFYSALCHEIGIPESKDYSLTRNLRDRRILLAIDNVGKMTWEGFTRGVRDRLRGLAEGSTAPLKLILAASEPLERLFNDSQDEGKTSPLAGICQEENLKPWDETTARAFIDARLAMTSVRFSKEEIIQLVQESGGHPRRLMQLCYRTYSRYMEGGE